MLHARVPPCIPCSQKLPFFEVYIISTFPLSQLAWTTSVDISGLGCISALSRNGKKIHGDLNNESRRFAVTIPVSSLVLWDLVAYETIESQTFKVQTGDNAKKEGESVKSCRNCSFLYICMYMHTDAHRCTHTRANCNIYKYIIIVLFLLLYTGFLSCDFLTHWLQNAGLTGLVAQVRWESCRLAALSFDWGW